MGDNEMSIFIAGAIAGASLIAGLLVALSEQIRPRIGRRGVVHLTPPRRPAERVAGTHRGTASVAAQQNVAAASISRAAAYREILDALGDDLDEDIAEWEAVLQDFPQVIGADELLAAEVPMIDTAQETTAEVPQPDCKPIRPPQRTRRISADEQDMIQRLLRTEFAPEEIALWLNLPLERVQEFLFGD
jgi:hypothetical protein